MIEKHPALMRKLDEYLFDHLANVTTLSIKAPIEGILGLASELERPGSENLRHAPLTLKADQMPLLTTLLSDYIFASRQLTDFLVGHKDTLEKVILRRCYASIDDLAHNGIYWSEFFSVPSSTCPAKLRCFEIVESRIPSTTKEDYFEDEDMPDEICQARTILLQDPRRRFFPYAYLDEKYGMFYMDEEKDLASFFNGEDQRSWDRLMELVEGNANEAAKSEK